MTITAEELRKVYSDESLKSWTGRVEDMHGAALLAVAKFVAERQRAVEPTEEMIDAPRQIILYSETPGRSVKGLREHLELAGVEYTSWFPEWAKSVDGHLTKGGIADLVYRAMQSVAPLVVPSVPTVREE